MTVKITLKGSGKIDKYTDVLELGMYDQNLYLYFDGKTLRYPLDEIIDFEIKE